MKIHYIVPDFCPNETGFAIAFKNFCLAIVNRDEIDKIIVYSPIKLDVALHPKIEIKYSNKHVRAEFFIRRFGKKTGYFLAKIYLYKWLKTFKSIDENSGDFIFVESIFLSYISLMLEKMYPKIPVITRIHGALPEVAYWTKEKYRNNLMDFVLKTKKIAVTTYHYIDYLNLNFNPKHDNSRKYYIIPNTLPKVSEVFKSKTNGDLKLLQLGRMASQGFFQKGFQDVLQALYYLEETQCKEVLNGIEYTFIGDGPLIVDFLKKLKKLKHIKVRHYPRLPNLEVQKEIEESSVILMPSRYEGMSMFATEVLAKGKPFIFTSDGGMRDMIINDYNGIAIRPFDYLELSEAIMLFKDKLIDIEEFSKNSIAHFNKEFSYEVVSDKFGVVLKDI